MDWIMRRKANGTDCKHIRKIKETLANQPARDFKPIAPNYTVKPYQAPSRTQVDTSRDIRVGDYIIRPRQLDLIPEADEEITLNIRRRSL
jgi:hypothetical protein